MPPRRTIAERMRGVGRVLGRARAAGRRRDQQRSRVGRALTASVCVLAGLMIVMSAVNARGTDLRPGRNTDLIGLISAQSRRNTDLSRQLTGLRRQVDQLAAAQNEQPDLGPQLERLRAEVGLEPVAGPAVTVTLRDAPASVAARGVDPDLLVVHSQDIQAVVNALWRGGAGAMTIQGQRVIATTGVKCVGNTVVLHGIPYAPPYVITAIGDQRGLRAALQSSQAVQIYQQYVAAYDLGYSTELVPRVTMPADEGALDLQSARVPTSSPAPDGVATPGR